MNTRSLKNKFGFFVPSNESEKAIIPNEIATHNDDKISLSKAIKQFTIASILELLSASKVGGISYSTTIYYRSLRFCSKNDAVCSNELYKKLGYVTFSFAIADVVFNVLAKLLNNYSLKKLNEYWHGHLLDLISMHGFLLQFTLIVHQEIYYLIHPDDDKELTTSNAIFIAEILAATLITFLSNAKVRNLFRKKILRYPSVELNPDKRSKIHKGIDFSMEFINGFAAGRGWVLGIENFTALFYKYNPSKSVAAIWLTWSSGIVYGFISAFLNLFRPKHDHSIEIITMDWAKRINITLSAILYLTFTIVGFNDIESPHKEIQIGLFGFLAFIILGWAFLNKCCHILPKDYIPLEMVTKAEDTSIIEEETPIYHENNRFRIFHRFNEDQLIEENSELKNKEDVISLEI